VDSAFDPDFAIWYSVSIWIETRQTGQQKT